MGRQLFYQLTDTIYPGVIPRWTTESRTHPIETVEDLARAARDARDYRFRELEELLKGLQGDQRKMAIRIALVPSTSSRANWQALRKVIIGEITEEVFDDLISFNQSPFHAGCKLVSRRHVIA